MKALKRVLGISNHCKASVEAVVRRILAYTARPLTEFIKYEALEIIIIIIVIIIILIIIILIYIALFLLRNALQ